jgi:hypothetical protein
MFLFIYNFEMFKWAPLNMCMDHIFPPLGYCFLWISGKGWVYGPSTSYAVC